MRGPGAHLRTKLTKRAERNAGCPCCSMPGIVCRQAKDDDDDDGTYTRSAPRREAWRGPPTSLLRRAAGRRAAGAAATPPALGPLSQSSTSRGTGASMPARACPRPAGRNRTRPCRWHPAPTPSRARTRDVRVFSQRKEFSAADFISTDPSIQQSSTAIMPLPSHDPIDPISAQDGIHQAVRPRPGHGMNATAPAAARACATACATAPLPRPGTAASPGRSPRAPQS
eukprot:CAMPEP_0205998262 /NCGR_PEP_ID=MMETSP1464-20131121/145_1 /ASSEMBLY_ACC=CAM_ASM_001124 /TAXON_ID=119497 /ORGANISM="Exanthemachrysis gayraliae, Strain RCC1523" /LENGTH=226 /DNA_ID=CAMNT_0053371405 /DNA_START=20 /DNA_END=699 /DNA_ORIENTATION=+